MDAMERRGWYLQGSPKSSVLANPAPIYLMVFVTSWLDHSELQMDIIKWLPKFTLAIWRRTWFPWYNKTYLAFGKKHSLFLCMMIHHLTVKLTIEYLDSVFARHWKITQWPSCSPDLNAIATLRRILKWKIYSRGRQYTSKNYLWDSILTAAKNISSDEIWRLTFSMDQRLFSLFLSCIKMAVICNH